jgi:hypothetical protein
LLPEYPSSHHSIYSSILILIYNVSGIRNVNPGLRGHYCSTQSHLYTTLTTRQTSKHFTRNRIVCTLVCRNGHSHLLCRSIPLPLSYKHSSICMGMLHENGSLAHINHGRTTSKALYLYTFGLAKTHTPNHFPSPGRL